MKHVIYSAYLNHFITVVNSNHDNYMQEPAKIIKGNKNKFQFSIIINKP